VIIIRHQVNKTVWCKKWKRINKVVIIFTCYSWKIFLCLMFKNDLSVNLTNWKRSQHWNNVRFLRNPFGILWARRLFETIRVVRYIRATMADWLNVSLTKNWWQHDWTTHALCTPQDNDNWLSHMGPGIYRSINFICQLASLSLRPLHTLTGSAVLSWASQILVQCNAVILGFHWQYF